MYPYITIGDLTAPTFSICVAVGMCVFILWVVIKAHKADRTDRENFFIVPKIFISFGFGYLGALFFEALVHIPENGGFKLVGIMFYGGAITGMASMAIMLKIREKKTAIPIGKWLDMMTVPFVAFHCIGRIGCFFGGCCYGMVSDGPFGVMFPDVPDSGIFHYGHKVLPTQLYEAAALLLLAVALSFVKKNRFTLYMVLYAVIRFSLEFLRADSRGIVIAGLSPSQFIATLVVYVVVAYLLVKRADEAMRRRGRVLYLSAEHIDAFFMYRTSSTGNMLSDEKIARNA